MKPVNKRLSAMLAVVVVAIACAAEESKSMEDWPSREVAERLLNMPDQRYFELNPAETDELTDAFLSLHDFEGTVIGMPHFVNVETQDELPLLWVTRATGLRSWQVEYKRNSVLIISNLSNGDVSLHSALAGPKRIDYRHIRTSALDAHRPENGQEASIGLAKRVLDLRSISNMSWTPGRLAATMLIYDWKSNTETVILTGGAGEDVEITPRHRSAYVTVARDANVAERVTSDAVIQVPSVGSMTAPVTISASIRLPREDVVLAPDAENSNASVLLGTVILFKLDVLPKMPLRADTVIPARALHHGEGRELVATDFEFDLHKALPYQLSGTYQTYFVFGAKVLGPYPLTLEQ